MSSLHTMLTAESCILATKFVEFNSIHLVTDVTVIEPRFVYVGGCVRERYLLCMWGRVRRVGRKKRGTGCRQ